MTLRGAALAAPRLSARVWSRLSAGLLDRLDAALGLTDNRRERGGATVEFVLLLPAFLMVFISSFDSSLLLIRQVMLERAVDITVRDIRLDSKNTVTKNQVRTRVCNRARILPDCNANLLIELTEITSPDFAVPTSDTPCVNQLTSIAPNTGYASNRTGKMILLRACYSVPPGLPLAVSAINRTLASHLVNDEDGTVRMVTSSTFVVEADF